MLLLPLRSSILSCWSVRLLVVSAIIVAGTKSGADLGRQAEKEDGTSDESTSDELEAPEMGSRSIKGGQDVGLLPKWEFPIFCSRKETSNRVSGNLDGYLCGIGIRVSKYGFLASTLSILEALTVPSDYKDWTNISFFNPNHQRGLSILKPDGDFWQFLPRFKKQYGKHKIALFKMERRFELPANRPPHPPRYYGHPVFANDTIERSNCRVYAFGSNSSDQGTRQPNRVPTVIHVKKLGNCTSDHLCNFGPTGNKNHTAANLDGALCGGFSNLGAPVTCGRGETQRLQYIISELPEPAKDESGKCSRFFKAFNVAPFGNEIFNDIANITKL